MSYTVAIVANSAWNLYNYRQSLHQSLRKAGHRVVLIAPLITNQTFGAKPAISFIPLRHLSRSGINPLENLALQRELADIFRREAVTHALLFTIKPAIFGSLAARQTGVVALPTLTGLGYTFLSGAWLKPLVRLLYTLALRQASRVLFHNPDDLAVFVQKGLCRPEQAIVVGGSGVSLERLPLVSYADATPGRCVFAGRLLKDKGILEYVAAARLLKKQYPQLQFEVVGSPDPGNPSSISKRTLAGWISEGVITHRAHVSDIRPVLAAASLVVLPSYREGCPRVLLEAAAMGRALVGAAVAGTREIVIDKITGRLVPTRSSAALAEVLAELLTGDPALLATYGQQGRELVARKFQVAQIDQVYVDLIAQFPPKA